jgi:N6-L-threonylcarbamoyladenine synthase
MASILAVETSCDETSAAVVRDGRYVVSNVTSTQEAIHRRYGGIVPEVASREHLLTIAPVVEEAVDQAGGWAGIDAVASVHGPGLAGSLLVGVNLCKALALGRDLPLLGINHLEGHVYANWVYDEANPSEPPEFPLLALIVSGGHSELVLMRNHGDYQLVGQTRDDAAGEAFDKTARLLGLGYPGGPAIQKAAEGSPHLASPPVKGAEHVRLPRAWLPGTHDFSFSGLKTAVLRLVNSPHEESDAWTAAVAAEFQRSVVEVLTRKTVAAAEELGVRSVALAGGVAANKPLREALQQAVSLPFHCPRLWLCTDNAAMSAAAGYFHLIRGDIAGLDLDVIPSLRLAA